MIRFIKGPLAAIDPQTAIIDVGGVGYEVNIPSNSNLYLETVGNDVTVFTHLAVREDDMSLFGFTSRQELSLFEKLITVNGVGAKAALSILSAMPVSEIKKAIVFEDVDMITRANGIGKKTAQKIVLELKDKIEGIGGAADDAGTGSTGTILSGSNKDLAVEALLELGFTRTEATEALIGVGGDGQELSIEEYVKQGLKNR